MIESIGSSNVCLCESGLWTRHAFIRSDVLEREEAMIRADDIHIIEKCINCVCVSQVCGRDMNHIRINVLEKEETMLRADAILIIDDGINWLIECVSV